MLRRRPTTLPRTALRNPVSEPYSAPAADADVVKIVQGRLEVDSVDRWVSFCGPAVEEALRRGVKTSSEVLAYVMRKVLPRYPWPPPTSSSLFPQWRQMVADVAELLCFEPEPETRTQFRVVK